MRSFVFKEVQPFRMNIHELDLILIEETECAREHMREQHHLDDEFDEKEKGMIIENLENVEL